MRKSTFSLRTKLTILYLLTLSVPVVIITYILPSYYQDLIKHETENLTEGTLTAVTRNIETYLDDLERLTKTPYLNDDVMGAIKLKASKRYDSADNYTRLVADRALSSTLPNFLQNTRQDILGTILLPFDGSVFVTSIRNLTGPVPGYPFTSQSWYKKALVADGKVAFISAHSQDYLTNPAGTQVFSVARMIKDPDSLQPIAVIMADADAVILKKILDDVNFNVSSVVTVLDDQGQLLYSTRSLAPEILKQATTSSTTNNSSQNSYTVISRTIQPAEWKVVVLLSNAELASKSRWVYLVGILFAIGGLVLTLLLFAVLSYWIVNPFARMKEVMRKVQRGDLTVRFINSGQDEIAQLGNALNTMLARFEELIEREYKAVLGQRNAEYLALQSQIQPHFLYNTLNGFIGLNRIGDRQTLEKAILSLSSLLRYILEQTDWVTLQDEFLFLQRYCELQQLRFQERLQVNFHYDEAVAAFRLPKLLLQPLVENAIIHGVEPLDRVCTLKVTAEVNPPSSKEVKLDSSLFITVEDDGVGFNLHKLAKATSLGLSNVSERLKVAYPEASLHITSSSERGTQVVIEIPSPTLVAVSLSLNEG